jgi:hypothetical protein
MTALLSSSPQPAAGLCAEGADPSKAAVDHLTSIVKMYGSQRVAVLGLLVASVNLCHA